MWTVLANLPTPLRKVLYRTIFTDIDIVTEQDMTAILFGMYKDMYVEKEEDFYEPMDQKYFWVHKMKPEDQEWEALVSIKKPYLQFTCIIMLLLSCCFNQMINKSY